MVRVLNFDAQGVSLEGSGSDLIKRPREGVSCWIDLQKPDMQTLSLLGATFGFHPLTIDDCAHFDQIPKLEDYGDYIFFVTHSFELLPDGNLKTLELHSFIGKNFLVTVHDEMMPAVDLVWKRMSNDPGAVLRGVDFIRYLLADAAVNTLYPIVNQLIDDTEAVEANILSAQPAREVLREILDVKRLNVMLRKVLIPQRIIMTSIGTVGEKFISAKTAIYMRDVQDHLVRITETLETNRELVESVLAGYQWAVSQRTNEIVKRLTLLSAIFLPLTFITGFFGQNFVALPFGSTAVLVFMLVSCAVVPITMFWYFLRSNWL